MELLKASDFTESYIEEVVNNLKKLIITPGPIRCIARLSVNDPRVQKDFEFPMKLAVEEIIEQFRRDDGTDLSLNEHNGNLVILSNCKNMKGEQIRKIPVTLVAHLDEITYLIKNKIKDNYFRLSPLFAGQVDKKLESFRPLPNPKVEIYSFRKRKLEFIGQGKVWAKTGNINHYNEEYVFNLETDVDVYLGDMCFPSYGPRILKDDILLAKALDDRAGSICCLYAVKELAKQKVPAKLVLCGDEEGVPSDTSWSRLTLKTLEKYASRNNVILMSDGIDGKKLKNHGYKVNTYVEDAISFPITSDGKGGGDLGIFSLIRDEIIRMVSDNGFKLKLTSAYVSRSVDPKIMNDYPYLAFIDWSNGKVGVSTCHLEESIKVAQLRNIIGSLFHSALFFYNL